MKCFSLSIISMVLMSPTVFAQVYTQPEMKLNRQVIRCLNRADHDQRARVVSELYSSRSLTSALETCRESDGEKNHPENLSSEVVKFLAHVEKPQAYQCKKFTLTAAAAMFVGVEAHTEAQICETHLFKTKILLGLGAGLSTGAGTGVIFDSNDHAADLPSVKRGFYTNQANTDNIGIVFMTTEEKKNGGLNQIGEDADTLISLFNRQGESIEAVRGVGVGLYSTRGFSAGLSIYSSITEENVKSFHRALGFRPRIE